MKNQLRKLISNQLKSIIANGPVIITEHETSQTGRVWKSGWDFDWDPNTPFWKWTYVVKIDGVKVN